MRQNPELCFQDEVERRCHRPTEAGEAGLVEYLPKPCLASLRAEHHVAAVGNRVGAADRRRCGIIHAGDWRDVVVDPVVGEELDQHNRPIRRKRSCRMLGCRQRVSHVVKAIEEADEVIAFAGIVFGARRLELDAVETRRGRSQGRSSCKWRGRRCAGRSVGGYRACRPDTNSVLQISMNVPNATGVERVAEPIGERIQADDRKPQ